MNLFEICTVTQAVFDDDNWTGEVELDIFFAYNEEDIEKFKFISEMNEGVFKIWETK